VGSDPGSNSAVRQAWVKLTQQHRPPSARLRPGGGGFHPLPEITMESGREGPARSPRHGRRKLGLVPTGRAFCMP